MSAINHFIKKGVRQAEIDEYLGEELSRAGYGGVEIAKTPLGERITIHAARPGIVIGRRGKNIRSITDELITRFGFENPQIEVKEVNNPELNAKVMAYSLVSAIERGVHRRRAAYSVLRRVVNSGAKGCEILISGKLTSKRSRHEAYRMGLVAKSGELGTEYVQRANATAVMKLGSIGVTVNIMRGDLPLPDEITIKNIRLEDDVTSEITEIIEEIPEKPVKIQEEVPKEKIPKKETVEEPKKIKEVTKKKTDLDKEVEELSDLIEKTPGEEAKPKPTKKKETTEKKPTTPTKKPSVTDDKKTKKEDVKVKPPVKKSEEKAKIPAKKVDEKSKTKTASKKEEVKAKAPAKKVEEKPKASKKDEKESKTKTKKEGKK